MKKNIYKNSRGFTIIETMITMTIFIVVVLVGMSTLLNASSAHRKSNDQRTIIDNLNFIMEDMSRNIRTGYNIRCVSSGVIPSASDFNTPQSCPEGFSGSLGGGQMVVFESSGGSTTQTSDQWIYNIKNTGSGKYVVEKSTDGGASFSTLNPEGIIFSSSSGFFVSGAETPSMPGADKQQPLVKIRLKGEIIGKDNVRTPFAIQTTASQRAIDSH